MSSSWFTERGQGTTGFVVVAALIVVVGIGLVGMLVLGGGGNPGAGNATTPTTGQPVTATASPTPTPIPVEIDTGHIEPFRTNADKNGSFEGFRDVHVEGETVYANYTTTAPDNKNDLGAEIGAIINAFQIEVGNGWEPDRLVIYVYDSDKVAGTLYVEHEWAWAYANGYMGKGEYVRLTGETITVNSDYTTESMIGLKKFYQDSGENETTDAE